MHSGDLILIMLAEIKTKHVSQTKDLNKIMQI